MSDMILVNGQLFQCIDEEQQLYSSRCAECGVIYSQTVRPSVDLKSISRRCRYCAYPAERIGGRVLTSDNKGLTWVKKV